MKLRSALPAGAFFDGREIVSVVEVDPTDHYQPYRYRLADGEEVWISPEGEATVLFTQGMFEAWVRMNSCLCQKCFAPMRPCPKGPGADEPGYVGFYPCPCERTHCS